MKKIVLAIIAIGLAGAVSAQAPEAKIKKGKATIDESYYYMLRQMANDLPAVEKEADSLKEEIKRLKHELSLTKPMKLTNFTDSASYAIGKDMAMSWQQQNLGINIEAVAQSLYDIAHNKNNMKPETMMPLLQKFQTQFEEKQRKHQETMMSSLEQNKRDGKQFLKDNAKKKDVVTTKSGLQYKVLKKGNGKRPTQNNTVKVHYTGQLINGQIFDSSVQRGTPAEFPVGAVIPGWTEGLQLMDVGSRYMLYIPYNLAYGEQVVGEIPPGSTLIFEVELLDIVQ